MCFRKQRRIDITRIDSLHSFPFGIIRIHLMRDRKRRWKCDIPMTRSDVGCRRPRICVKLTSFDSHRTESKPFTQWAVCVPCDTFTHPAFLATVLTWGAKRQNETLCGMISQSTDWLTNCSIESVIQITSAIPLIIMSNRHIGPGKVRHFWDQRKNWGLTYA